MMMRRIFFAIMVTSILVRVVWQLSN
jgi:hypothetical protein